MYGKWLYKEISTEYGACKVEIYRKNYTGASIEIGALAANSLSIALENLGSITDPIGKSVCSFSIIDTDQVEYDDFFTPDATALKVVVSTRVGSGAYVPRWSGYVTPDFFAENLSYRTPISISARDNIGYLNDVDFDLTATTITVREFIQSAFKRIAEDYPMSLSFVTQKQTAEGILAIDATISTTLLREMSWGEALETILHDLGLQMRWVDNNTIAVLDLSQIPEYYATQSFNFIEASGYREIVPAWRELSQEQDFGLKENFFEGWLREDNITFVKSVVMRPPNATNWTTDIAYYVPNNWGVARDIYTTDPSYYGSKFGKKIFFTGVSEQNPTTTYFSWRQQIQSSIVPMKMSFKAFNSVLSPSEKYANLTTPSGRRLVAYNPKDAFHGQKVGEYLQIGLKANVLLHSGLKTYILKSEWVEISDDGAGWQLDFTLPKVELSYVEGNQATAVEPREEEITINIATIPYDGELEFRIYGWYIVGKHNYWEDDYSVTNYTFDWLKCLAYINEPTFSFNTDEADSGRETNVMIAEAHNIKQEESYTFGQTFSNGGGLNAYAGALVGTDGNELIGFQRNADATNYNLLELVGREIIHFNKRNYNRLSGTIRNLDKEPLMFNRLFVREGKKYAPYNYSLNVISNEMNITSMQEVELYTTANFSEVYSEVSTGGSTVSSGNNQILQYSAEVGNAKRLYELQTISENEKPDAYVLVDGAGYPEARKLKLTDIAGLDEKALEQYLVQYKYLQEADLTPIIQDFEKLEEVVNPLFGYFDANGNANNALKLGGHSAEYFATADSLNTHIKAFNTYKTTTDNRLKDLEALWYMDDDGNVHTTHNIVVDKGGAFGMGAESGDVPSASVSIKFDGSTIVYSPVDGIITLPAYPSGGGGVADSVDWLNVYNKPTTLGGYGITDALSTSGGTISSSQSKPLVVNSNYADSQVVEIALSYNNTQKGFIGYYVDGAYIGDSVTGYRIGVRQDGEPVYKLSWSGVEHTLYHTGNFNPANYLPLSGGTIEGGSGIYTPLSIKNTSLPEVWIGFQDSVGTCYIGSAAGVPSIYMGAYNQTIIHSGNIGSQSVNYANSAGNADTLGGYSNSSYFAYRGWSDQNANEAKMGSYFTYSNNAPNTGPLAVLGVDGYDLQLNAPYIDDNCHLSFRTRNGDYGYYNPWVTLARVDGNVASATKLQTGRYLWGNYFNGESGVSGNPEYNYGGHLFFYNSAGSLQSAVYADNTLYLGMGYTNSSTIVMGGAVHLRYGSGGTDGLVVNNQGNVLIGTTFDSGAKLQVVDATKKGAIASQIRASAIVEIGGIESGNDGLYIGQLSNSTIWMQSAYGGSSSIPSNKYTYTLSLQPIGGNVLIGTAEDNGHKLQVEGGIRATRPIFGYMYGYNSNAAAFMFDKLGLHYTGIGSDGTADTIRFGACYVDGNWVDYSQNWKFYGNIIVTGGGAFGSDIRYKDIISYRQLDLETIVNAPLFSFRWTDREDKVEHLGTSAQYWLDTQFKDAVNITNPKFFHLDYGALAVGIGISVAREVKGVKTEVEVLRDEVRQLKKKLNEYEAYGTIRI